MMTYRKLISLFIISIASSNLHAQDCAADNIKPKTGIYGYRQRLGDQRCEGLFTENVSGQSLDVLSFTQGRLRYYLSKDEKLTIKVPAVPNSKDIKVRGISFGMFDSYRLDLEIGLNNSKKVPVDEVLEPNKISEKNLGLYGFVQTDKKENVYLPVSVSSKKYDDRIPNSDSQFLKLLSNTPIEKAEWRYATNNKSACGSYTEFFPVAGSIFTPQIPMVIELPETIPQGAICLNIRYKTVAGEWNNKTFQLFIP